MGPSTVVTPKTAPRAPWYFPRSRSGMMSAMTAVAVTIRQPAAKPWTARQPISQLMLAARPHIAEATTNTAAETWKSSLRPNWSPNLPASTVAMVSASRYDDTTQDRCSAPPRSPTMVGRAVETMVWSSAASSIPTRIVTNTRFIRRRSSGSASTGRSSRTAAIRTSRDPSHPACGYSAPPVLHASARFAQRPQNMIVLNVSVWWKPTLA